MQEICQSYTVEIFQQVRVRVVEYKTGRRLKYRGVYYSQSVQYSSFPAHQQLVYRSRRYRPAALMLSGLLRREESIGLRRNK